MQRRGGRSDRRKTTEYIVVWGYCKYKEKEILVTYELCNVMFKYFSPCEVLVAIKNPAPILADSTATSRGAETSD